MRHTHILVPGGAGFIGRHVVNFLIGRGCRVTVPTRRRERAKHLIVLPACDVVEADLFDAAALARLAAGQHAVINLVGILQGSAADFARAHVELTRRLLAACSAAGIRRYLQMSALGADAQGPSHYQRSKGEAEALVRASGLDWTIFRPSVVFGPEDRFLNTFAALARWAPALPLPAADARFQPVWVEDVAQACVNALDQRACYGQAYELAGPRIYTLRELVRFAAAAAGHRRRVFGLPPALARMQARVLELMPGEPLLSRDNLASMTRDNVAGTQPYLPAPELGIAPVPLEPVASQYLAGPRARSRYAGFRAHAGR